MIVILAVSFLLQTPTPESFVWERYSTVGTQHWTSAVTQADIDGAPKWDVAATDIPPLSPGEAIRATRTVMEKLTLESDESETGKWRVGHDGVGLHPASHGWIYIVNFEAVPKPCDVPGPCAIDRITSGGMNIIVLMSGRAIVPVQTK